MFIMAYYCITIFNSNSYCFNLYCTVRLWHFYLHVHFRISFATDFISGYCQYDFQHINEQVLRVKKIQICN